MNYGSNRFNINRISQSDSETIILYCKNNRTSIRSLIDMFPHIFKNTRNVISFLKKYNIQLKRLLNEEIIEKRKITCYNRYNVNNVFQSDEIKNKIKDTMIKIYNVDHPAKSIKIKNKMKTTCYNKYGTSYALESKDIREKIKSTNLKKYGHECVFGSNYIKNKSKKTNLKKYGVEYYVLLNKTIIRSSKETEICNILDELNITYEKNTRQIIYPYEIDIFIPTKNTGIEFNGEYWHNKDRWEANKNNQECTHNDCPEQYKTLLCANKNIKLIHIWGDEWKMIKNKKGYIQDIIK